MLAQKFIPLMVPDMQQQDVDAVVKVLKSGMLIQGREVEALENNIACYLGIKHAVAVSNGTASLHLALVALGIGKGDEVIVPAFSYIATANVVELVGATPVFVDIDIKSFNIDTQLIEKSITKHTKAIIPVHEFGLACDITHICQIAKKYNLAVIEDAACALGAKENNKYAGTFGCFGSFSFHPRKAITSGEGGLLVTNDDALAKKVRVLRNHGIDTQNGKMEFVEAGFNYRLTDFQASLVNSQFQRLEKILMYRNILAEVYLDKLKNNVNIQLPAVPETKTPTWQSFHVLVEGNRDELISILKDKGIGTNYGAQCMPFEKYYQQKYKFDCARLFPNALKSYQQGLVLPLYGKIDKDDIYLITRRLLEALED